MQSDTPTQPLIPPQFLAVSNAFPQCVFIRSNSLSLSLTCPQPALVVTLAIVEAVGRLGGVDGGQGGEGGGAV